MADNHPSATGDAGPWRLIPAILAALGTLWFARFLGPVAHGETPELVVPWVPSLGIEAAFRLDGLALAFALLICGIGAICFLYAATYFRGDARLGSLLVILVAFAISMLGLVTADDAVTLFVFWEATTITSWLLVGFDHERPAARAAALQALLITGAGGLALLAGLLLMGGVAGGYRLSAMNAAGDLFRDHALYPAIFALVILGCFTKSAQFPFQFWLPGAMAAPTPVSAYLHSATMVKAGVYLMARLSPSLGGTELWISVLTPVGGFTMLLASIWAVRQTDMKLLLAYTTVMALGLMTMLLGTSTPVAVAAAMTFLLVHAFYKAALFLAVGMIEKGAGSRDYPAVGGLAGAMPLTAAVAGLAALSMAGFPPMFGFVGKEVIYQGTTGAVTVAALLANAAMVACAAVVTLRPFLGRRTSPRAQPADPGWGLWLGPSALAALGLAFGLFPGVIGHALVAPMTRAVTGGPMPVELELWHGINAAFLLSLATFALGGLLYANLDRLRDALAAAEPRLPRTEGWYDAALAGCLAFATSLTGAVQNGRMTSYLRTTFLLFAALIWGALVIGGAMPRPMAGATSLVDWAVLALICASIVAVLRTSSRLTAICALGGVGAGIAIIFVLYGAIDVAMTQLFVEVLVVVFLAIAMARLPRMGPPRFHAGNAAVAILLGLGVTLSALAVLSTPLDPFMSRFFEEKSAPVALGHNIVNVILVDFRGFDTMGEISVIVIAGVAAIAALRAGRRAAK
ncbi:MAG: hydrogen gas-evolving membrane-bound hydrogenase subunit E [Amaricoccus sp.]|uniref:hydrogen gas-evolving membrane-bound hydrogenase subunit E n=1 Tax=Amaricoccus sp. TaxID=1872485 RepID=UPI0033145EA7